MTTTTETSEARAKALSKAMAAGTTTRGNPVGRILFYVLVGAILVYTAFPFYWALRSSLLGNADLFATPVQYVPTNLTLSNYQQVFSNDAFLYALRNSVFVAGLTTVLSLVIGALASYALGRFRFRGRTPILYLILAMTMFPQVAVLGALYDMVNKFRLFNTPWALILTYLIFTLPFTVWVLTSFFQQMPKDLEEAAYVDGASPFQTFYMVMLPLVGPGLVTTGLLAFIGAWNEFLYALSFTQTPENRTVTYAITAFAPQTGGGFEIPWGQMMAATVVVTVPLIVLTLIFQRYILGGLTAGAVKG
jgi:trehalose/maltose transport system permease protein